MSYRLDKYDRFSIIIGVRNISKFKYERFHLPVNECNQGNKITCLFDGQFYALQQTFAVKFMLLSTLLVFN